MKLKLNEIKIHQKDLLLNLTVKRTEN